MESSNSVPPGLLARFEDGNSPRSECLPEGGVHICHIRKAHARASWERRRRFAKHHDGVAYLHLRMSDCSVGCDLALTTLDASEYIAKKADEELDVIDDEVRVEAAVSVGNATRGHGQIMAPGRSRLARSSSEASASCCAAAGASSGSGDADSQECARRPGIPLSLEQVIHARSGLSRVLTREHLTPNTRTGEPVSDATLQGNELPVQHSAARTDSPSRDWASVGLSLGAAFALVALFVAGMWGLVVIVEASI